MQISNVLEIYSFQFTEEKPNMAIRDEEIDNLADIFEYCKNIKETIQYDQQLWEIEVENGVSFADWLYCYRGEGTEDRRRFILDLISKVGETPEEEKQVISVSLGKYNSSAYDEKSYVLLRRNILKKIQNYSEFGEFMPTCFMNSIFADNIVSEMKYIADFSDHTEEIVNNLSVLNDEAIRLYEKYHDNLQEAMKILSAKLIECSPDPKHVDSLKFTFSYEEQINGENETKNKNITCSPHLKLIHKGSNLRIYF